MFSLIKQSRGGVTLLALIASLAFSPLRANAQPSEPTSDTAGTCHCGHCASCSEGGNCDCSTGSDVVAAQAASVPSQLVADHPQSPSAGPHGGQLSTVGSNEFEVVYLPRETRLYVYDASHQPIAPKGLRGEMNMRVRGTNQVQRFELHPASSPARDYLSAATDASQIPDGGMVASFVIAAVNWPADQGVRFSQTFARAQQSYTVSIAALTDADRPAIAAQGTCPVTGEKLGSMGQPIKLLVGNTPLYVCCKGCVKKVQQNPQFYLAKISHGPAPATPQQAPSQQTQIGNDPRASVITVQGMHCASCEQHLSEVLNQLPNVRASQASAAKGMVVVLPGDGKRLPSPRAQWEAVEAAGFTPTAMSGPFGKFDSKPKF